MNIYTDGGAVPNPGAGGYGVIVTSRQGRVIKTLSGTGGDNVTNNQMEIIAAIKALEWVHENKTCAIYSDSRYLVQSMLNWVPRRGYVGYANETLFEELLDIIQQKNLKVSWHWVKGHDNNHYNNHADRLATRAILGEQYDGN